MKENYLIGLYNELYELVGYFHNDIEVNRHLEFLKGLHIDTDNWKIMKNYFKL